MFFFWHIVSETAKYDGDLLRKARLLKGLSQQEVATRAGIHIKDYQRLEYGQRSILNASMKTGIAICHVLGIDPETLVINGYTDTDKTKN